jgi:hypothetical protein
MRIIILQTTTWVIIIFRENDFKYAVIKKSKYKNKNIKINNKMIIYLYVYKSITNKKTKLKFHFQFVDQPCKKSDLKLR